MDESSLHPLHNQTIIYQPGSEKEEAYRVPSETGPLNLSVGDLIADTLITEGDEPKLWLEIVEKRHSFHHNEITDESIQVTEIYTKIAIRITSWVED